MSLSFFSSEVVEFFIRLIVDVLASIVLIRGIYYRYQPDREFAFTYFLFNIIIFFVTHLFFEVGIDIGFAFGLFAIFGIIRYRTKTMPTKEMTYLYTVIAIALINGIGPFNWKSAVMQIIIVFFVYAMEKIWFSNQLQVRQIKYNRIDIIENHTIEELMKDLKQRTKLNIVKVDILSYDFVRGSAMLKVYFLPD